MSTPPPGGKSGATGGRHPAARALEEQVLIQNALSSGEVPPCDKERNNVDELYANSPQPAQKQVCVLAAGFLFSLTVLLLHNILAACVILQCYTTSGHFKKLLDMTKSMTHSTHIGWLGKASVICTVSLSVSKPTFPSVLHVLG